MRVTRRADRWARHRFSGLLAQYLGMHLMQLRAQVRVLAAGSVERGDALVDLGRRDVLVLLDFRRYEPATARLAEQARARSVKVVLVNDRWLSPASASAHVVLPVHVDAPSP